MLFEEYKIELLINARTIHRVRIGRHYKLKHGSYMNDALILELLQALDGGHYPEDSSTNGIKYYAADVVHYKLSVKRVYRLIWIFEGDFLEILGVVNAYRRKTKRNGKS